MHTYELIRTTSGRSESQAAVATSAQQACASQQVSMLSGNSTACACWTYSVCWTNKVCSGAGPAFSGKYRYSKKAVDKCSAPLTRSHHRAALPCSCWPASMCSVSSWLIHLAVLGTAHLLSGLCHLIPEADERGVLVAQRLLKLLQGGLSMPLGIDKFAKLLVTL